MRDHITFNDKDEYDCWAPECTNDSTHSVRTEIGTKIWLCRNHYRQAKRFEERDEAERFCESPSCGVKLNGSFPLSAKYCSTHCKNNASRARRGLPPSNKFLRRQIVGSPHTPLQSLGF